MHALKARVQNGRLLLDEPTSLPEGCEVELAIVSGDDLEDADRQALHQALDESLDDIDAGRAEDFDHVIAELRAQS